MQQRASDVQTEQIINNGKSKITIRGGREAKQQKRNTMNPKIIRKFDATAF